MRYFFSFLGIALAVLFWKATIILAISTVVLACVLAYTNGRKYNNDGTRRDDSDDRF